MKIKSIVSIVMQLSMLVGICAAEKSKPNIVLILADDLGYGDLVCYGATNVKTPNVDRLAGEGRRFTDAHSVSAVCTPSRYALLTGAYPFRKDIWGPAPTMSPLLIDTAETTLVSLLKRQGYATACFGKWHLGGFRHSAKAGLECRPQTGASGIGLRSLLRHSRGEQCCAACVGGGPSRGRPRCEGSAGLWWQGTDPVLSSERHGGHLRRKGRA